MASRAEKREMMATAIEYLRNELPRGSKLHSVTVYTRSARRVRVLMAHRKGSIRDISYLVGRALGERWNDTGVLVGGSGFSAADHLVSNLSYALHGFKKARQCVHDRAWAERVAHWKQHDPETIYSDSPPSRCQHDPGYTLEVREL